MASKSKRKKASAEPASTPASTPAPQPPRPAYVAIPRLMSRRDWQLVAVALGVAAFVAYALTSPAGITWEHFGEDGAEFAAVAKVFGVSHPTGYPLFTMLARLVSLGADENAWRVQLLVNAMAAAAVAVAFLLFWRLAAATAPRLPGNRPSSSPESDDGGATWTTAKVTGTLATALTTITLGGAADTWGRTWNAANFTDGNFRLRLIDVASSTSRDFFLDAVAVRRFRFRRHQPERLAAHRGVTLAGVAFD